MNGIVQAKLLGGFGNQIHQYVAARKYAEIVGAQIEVPDWIGKDIFGLSEPGWSRDLPEVSDGACGAPPEVEWGQTNIRLCGYFQTQRWIGLLSKKELKRWLPMRRDIIDLCPVPTQSYAAAHLRQGDYIDHPLYANVPERSYVRAAAEHGFSIDMWAKQDSPRRVPGLHDNLQFLPDFLVLMRAFILLRANSTFSWWAAALGDADVYAPLVTDHVGEYDADFVRGNWPRCADIGRVGIRVDDLYLAE